MNLPTLLPQSRILVSVFILALGCSAACCSELSKEQRPAFPGAMGYGRNSTGWRNGKIIYVTNTNDSGPGSLRNCAEVTEGPRVCVFAVGGTIEVDRPIFVKSNVYVAGQTALAQGIQLRLGRSSLSPLIVKNSHNVLLRFLKLRPGTSKLQSSAVSALLIENAHDVMIDHCSLSFATDQNFSVHFEGGNTHDITLQRSIISWGLDKANHPKGKHSKGALVCSGTRGPFGCGRVTLRENLFAHNRDRNPDIAGTALGPFQVINNVFYNPISQFGEFYDHRGSPQIDYVANLTVTGPSSRTSPPPVAVETYDLNPDNAVAVYATGNMSIQGKSWKPVAAAIVKAPGTEVGATPFSDFESFASASQLLELLLPMVGARFMNGALEDRLDAMLIGSVRERTGKVINDPSEVGGWPALASGIAIRDTDADGMPDDWEDAHGLDKQDPADAWRDRDNDGWSNVEEYLSGLLL